MLNKKAILCVGVAMLLVLTGCISNIIPIHPDPEDEYSVVRNVHYPVSSDEYPLFVGAKWVYRNATPDINPEIHSGATLTREVMSTVLYVEPSTDRAYECYVLQIRQDRRPTVQCYLHKSAEGVQIFGVEVLPYTGAPDLLPCNGELYLHQPVSKGDATQFTLFEGTSYDASVINKEYVPSRSVFTQMGPYTEGFGNAWRIQAEYGGQLADALGDGIEETWLSPGIGVVRRTAESQVYELTSFRARSEVVMLTEDDSGRHFDLPVGSVVAVQLRDPRGTQNIPGWECTNRQDVESAGVLSVLSGYSPSDSRFQDIADAGRLDSGSCVFLFEVKMPGEERLEFANTVQGDEIFFEFGESQPFSLSDPDVDISLNASTVVFSVKYTDPDGNRPSASYVCVDGDPCCPMTFSHGKEADGYYVSDPILLHRGLHTYCFRFSDDPAWDGDPLDLEPLLCQVFDIGGPLPFTYP